MGVRNMIPFELSTEESALVRGGFFRRSRENKGKTNMKQLKFMLAAATAVGLAAAAQADQKFKDTFENGELPAGYSYFPVDENDNDNDSQIEAEGYNSEKALKVNTGTNPLVRALDWDTSSESASAVPLSATKSVYIDTMVKFTVTPANDNPTPVAGDKLMIYVEEVPAATEGDPASNKLVIWAAADDVDYNPVATKCVTSESIDVDKWYHLYVESVAFYDSESKAYYPCFKVFLAEENGTLQQIACSAAFGPISTFVEDPEMYFPSLAIADAQGGVSEATITYVGFAGEGKVDDLAFGTIETVTSVDFTLALGEGVSSVKFTVGGNTFTLDAGTVDMTIEDLDLNSEAEIIEVKYAEYCVPATGDLIAGSKIALNAATVSKVVEASTKLSKVEGEVTPEAATTDYGVAKDAQIFTSTSDNATEAGAEITSAQIAKILDWNNRVNGGKIADVNSMKFVAGEPDGNSAEAFLLNCSTAELAKEKEEFKFSPEDLASLMTSGLSATGLDADKQKYIGEFVLEGASALNGEATDWKDSAKWTGEEKPAFYRARLIFK